jgi:glycosyltransferase involved in cell wall biosynthesis
MPNVSIVIPTFNRARLVTHAIETALNQTHPCEVVLCDHGSRDETSAVAARYAGRIRYIRREEDHGPVACWMDGIAQASGEYVHITYDDDWLEPTFVERCLALFRDDVGFVYSRYRICKSTTDTYDLSVANPAGIRPTPEIIFYLMRIGTTISPGCALFRRRDAMRNLLPEVPNAQGRYGKKSGVGEDVLLFMLTAKDYPYYAHVSEPLAVFLDHPASITINASESGKTQELVEAYTHAKRYFLSQAPKYQSSGPLRRLFSHWLWELSREQRLARLARSLRRRLATRL